MIAVHSVLPETPDGRPPVVLVHGAANSALVWTFWQHALAERGFPSHAVDLRGHGASAARDLSRTSMRDYAQDLRQAIDQLAAPPVVMGWSMGGLVAMMVAARGGVRACIGLAPSVPAERTNPAKRPQEGEFGPEEYGITSDDPHDQPVMPDLDREERVIALASLGRESRYARGERAAGVIVPALPCPLLVVTGTADRQWPRARYDGMHLPADYASIDGASHWGLVLSRRALATLVPDVVRWIERCAV